nr:flagellin [Synergistaceae bacterium]
NREVHFRNYYLNDKNGTVYEGDIVLTTNSDFKVSNMNDGDTLASFTSAYIGKIATGDTCLRDLDKFWNANGVFMLEDPQTITITQGDGKSAKVTLYATDTINDLKNKLNNAIANDLGQGQYVSDNANKFVTFVEEPENSGFETVQGTFLIRSIIPGTAGSLTFSGDEDFINAFATNVVSKSSETSFTASLYDAHTGAAIATGVTVTGNKLIGVLHENVDLEFDALADIKATWSESDKNFILQSSGGYEAVIHLTDSSTVFQTGANEGEDMAIDIGNMSADSLGITGVNVTTRASAMKAVGDLDAAITTVSRQRAKIGAYQNALEWTSENLSTTSTNLTAAESRIRDADMAKEMMEFVKLQILNQSGTSMLAQANQLPQQVLSLLQ